MRRWRAAAAAGVVVAGIAVACAGGAAGAVNIGGWGQITADMAGGSLVWVDAQAAKTKTFTYWRGDAARARVSGSGISGVNEPVTVRTSAGPLTGIDIRATGTSRGMTLTASRATSPVMIWS